MLSSMNLNDEDSQVALESSVSVVLDTIAQDMGSK
jgi:hypothetical protein